MLQGKKLHLSFLFLLVEERIGVPYVASPVPTALEVKLHPLKLFGVLLPGNIIACAPQADANTAGADALGPRAGLGLFSAWEKPDTVSPFAQDRDQQPCFSKQKLP